MDKNLVKKLKNLGLIDYDLRKNLKPQQKARITRLQKQYKSELEKGDKIKILKVTKTQAKKLKEKGITIKPGNHAVIDTPNKERVKITRTDLILNDPRRGKETKFSLKSGADLLLELEKKVLKKKKPKEYITVRLSTGQEFSAKFKSYEDLLNYLQAFVPINRTKGQNDNRVKNELFADMKIIKFNKKPRPQNGKPKRKSRGKL